jgi:hypothetical protein
MIKALNDEEIDYNRSPQYKNPNNQRGILPSNPISISSKAKKEWGMSFI